MTTEGWSTPERLAYLKHLEQIDVMAQCELHKGQQNYADKWLKTHRRFARFDWWYNGNYGEILMIAIVVIGLVYGTSSYY